LTTRSLAAWERVWAQNPQTSDIIVCLTTTPARLPYLASTLKSLLYQTQRPQLIRLHLPYYSRREQCAYIVPTWLQEMSAVEIIRCEDYGPATKLIPALQHYAPEQKLLVVDDDKLYPPTLIEHFFRCAQAYPQLAIGSSGWRIPPDLTDRPTTLWRNLCQTPPTPLKATRVRAPTPVDILQGYSGYLVRPAFFDVPRVADYQGAPPAAFFVDDVWISAHCTTAKVVFPAKRYCFEPWRRHIFQQTSLARINRGNGDPNMRNNTIMLRYFKQCW
jgi:hypothetical protein